MAVSQEDILARIQQIQQAGGGDTAATRAQIAQEAQQYGVTPEQLGQATGLLGSQVRSMAEEAGQAFAPTPITGGMLGGSNIDVTTPTTTPTVGQPSGVTMANPLRTNIDLTTPTPMPVTTQTGMLEGTTVDTTPAGLDDLPNFLGSSLLEKAEQTPLDAISKITQNDSSSIANLGSFIYQARKKDVKLPSALIEEIGYNISPDTTEAYNFAVHGQSVAEGYEALDNAIQAGDTAKATELRDALRLAETDFGQYWNYYNENIASSEGQAHGNLRQETTTGDTIFGVGDPKGGLKGSLERGIVRLGDAIGDAVDNPFVQAAVTFINPAAGSVLNAYATLDSGENLSPAQIAAALAGASELSGLEGGQLLNSLPEGVQKFVESAKDFAEGFEGRAVAALKQAFPNVDTEKLAEYEDNFKTFLAGGEDFVKEVIGDENIEAISGRFADFEDLITGQFGSQQDQLDELTAALASEGSGFTPQRGYQPGLPVDIEFDRPERSAVLDILNQPSSMRRA